MGTIVAANSSRALELLGYQYLISTANQQFSTSAVLSYDRAFRLAASGLLSTRWDSVNQTLWSIHLIRSPRTVLREMQCASQSRPLPNCTVSTALS